VSSAKPPVRTCSVQTGRPNKIQKHHTKTVPSTTSTTRISFGQNITKEKTSFFGALPGYLRILIIIALIIAAVAFYFHIKRHEEDEEKDDEDEEEEENDDVQEESIITDAKTSSTGEDENVLENQEVEVVDEVKHVRFQDEYNELMCKIGQKIQKS